MTGSVKRPERCRDREDAELYSMFPERALIHVRTPESGLTWITRKCACRENAEL